MAAMILSSLTEPALNEKIQAIVESAKGPENPVIASAEFALTVSVTHSIDHHHVSDTAGLSVANERGKDQRRRC